MMVVCFQMNSAKICACTKLELYYNITNVVPTQILDVYFTFYGLYAVRKILQFVIFWYCSPNILPIKNQRKGNIKQNGG